MPASPIVIPRSSRAGFWRWCLLLATPFAGVAFVSWWLTEPLDDEPAGSTAPPTALKRDSERSAAEAAAQLGPPAWPDQPLTGTEAKTLLLETLLHVGDRLKLVDGYTATFRKTERLHGVLGAEQTLSMKVRQSPFSVYFKFLNPHPGKEVVYAEGRHDNKVIAHSTGVARLLVPRLAVPPDHPLAMAETRHSITEAGLSNLTRKLIEFRRLDLEDHEAVTILDRVTDDAGRLRLRSTHKHIHKAPSRPFVHVEVLYDVESRIPVKISNYDWPDPGHAGHPALAEQYSYEDLDFTARLTSLDFDPANPAYEFHRY